MKARLIYLRFRIERRLATIPYRRVGASAFFIAGASACVSSGLGVFMDAQLDRCAIALLVGAFYLLVGAVLWNLE